MVVWLVLVMRQPTMQICVGIVEVLLMFNMMLLVIHVVVEVFIRLQSQSIENVERKQQIT